MIDFDDFFASPPSQQHQASNDDDSFGDFQEGKEEAKKATPPPQPVQVTSPLSFFDNVDDTTPTQNNNIQPPQFNIDDMFAAPSSVSHHVDNQKQSLSPTTNFLDTLDSTPTTPHGVQAEFTQVTQNSIDFMDMPTDTSSHQQHQQIDQTQQNEPQFEANFEENGEEWTDFATGEEAEHEESNGVVEEQVPTTTTAVSPTISVAPQVVKPQVNILDLFDTTDPVPQVPNAHIHSFFDDIPNNSPSTNTPQQISDLSLDDFSFEDTTSNVVNTTPVSVAVKNDDDQFEANFDADFSIDSNEVKVPNEELSVVNEKKDQVDVQFEATFDADFSFDDDASKVEAINTVVETESSEPKEEEQFEASFDADFNFDNSGPSETSIEPVQEEEQEPTGDSEDAIFNRMIFNNRFSDADEYVRSNKLEPQAWWSRERLDSFKLSEISQIVSCFAPSEVAAFNSQFIPCKYSLSNLNYDNRRLLIQANLLEKSFKQTTNDLLSRHCPTARLLLQALADLETCLRFLETAQHQRSLLSPAFAQQLFNHEKTKQFLIACVEVETLARTCNEELQNRNKRFEVSKIVQRRIQLFRSTWNSIKSELGAALIPDLLPESRTVLGSTSKCCLSGRDLSSTKEIESFDQQGQAYLYYKKYYQSRVKNTLFF